ncbi:hypothetical protein G7Y89_g10967 [Cudoniella acicularis]|uniref:Uncharacterized protein n=1 Tax=Cudoniella acicularis TaxID=354080 RepID=A0A8H4RBR6_9HELO|nr:hypothetical protein G7Y89_g10967 [Cudoniella acicularis]
MPEKWNDFQPQRKFGSAHRGIYLLVQHRRNVGFEYSIGMPSVRNSISGGSQVCRLSVSGIKRAVTVTEIFARVRPQGGTPTGIRIHNILKPYLAKLETEITAGKGMKPVNLIVLTDSVPSDDVKSVLLSATKKLDKLDAPPYQVGVQFF